MMTNLFSIFDPAVPLFMSLNWISVLIFMAAPFMVYWKSPNNYFSMVSSLFNFLFKEFSPIAKKIPHMLIFALALFMLIMTNNLSSNLPYVFPATSHMSITAALSISVWLTSFLFGWTKNTSNLLIHLIPKGAPVPLIPFMVIIETISLTIRPLTLALRLSANMIAGHLLVTLVSDAYMNSPIYAHAIIANFLNPLIMLELGVAFIQSYVFVILISLYTEESNS